MPSIDRFFTPHLVEKGKTFFGNIPTFLSVDTRQSIEYAFIAPILKIGTPEEPVKPSAPILWCDQDLIDFLTFLHSSNVIALKFDGHMTDSAIEYLCSFLKNNTSLKSLTLRGTESDLQEICKSLKENQGLRHFSLATAHMHLQTSTVQSLAEVIKGPNNTMQRVDIINCRINKDDHDIIASAYERGSEVCVEVSPSLCYTPIHPKVGANVSKGLLEILGAPSKPTSKLIFSRADCAAANKSQAESRQAQSKAPSFK